MKIKVFGNSFTWYPLPNTNFMINDEILLDTPQSSTKFMIGKVDFSKIKYIIITHFHSDHFTDLHIVLDLIKHEKTGKRVKIIAPKTAKRRLYKLFRILDVKYSRRFIAQYFEFIEIKPGQKIHIGNYTIESFKMKHRVKHCLGYTIQEDNGKVVGFTADTSMCDELINLVEKSDVIFIDTSAYDESDNHLSVSQVLELKNKYKNKKFYSIHASENIIKEFGKQLDIPKADDIIEI